MALSGRKRILKYWGPGLGSLSPPQGPRPPLALQDPLLPGWTSLITGLERPNTPGVLEH